MVVDGDEDVTSTGTDYSSWLSDTDECTWYGASCIEGVVHKLDLSK